jgi:hypothetical protein
MRLATFALALVLPSLSAAQQSAPSAAQGSAAKQGGAAQPVPSAAKDLSRLLVSQQRWEQLLDRYAAALSGQVSKTLASKGEPVPSDLQTTVRKQLGEKMPYQRTVDTQAQALAKQFTPDELKQISQFYATPAGKKLLDRLPEAQTEVGQQLESQLAVAVPEIVQRVAPKALPPQPEQGTGSSGTGSSEAPTPNPPGQGRSAPPPPNEQR